MNNIRILYVINNAEFFLSHRLDLAIAAQEEGCDVQIVVPQSDLCQQITASGFKIHNFPMSRSGLNLFQELRTLLALRKIFKKVKPDIVHLFTIKPVIYGNICASWLKVPKVVSAVTGLGHVFAGKKGILRRFITALYKFAFRHPNKKVIFQNSDDRELFLESGIIKSEESVLIQGSGVDPEKYPVMPEQTGIPVVILASRMLWNKGIDTFIEAANILQEKNTKVRLALVGREDMENPYGVPLTQLQEWAKNGPVEWWGFQGNMQEVFEKSTIVCLPSYYREGVPKVLIEAASCNRAIITTDMPGCRDIVKNHHNGLLIPIKDSIALADAIISLLNDPDMRKEMGTKGRQRVVEYFSLSSVIKRTLDVYKNV